MKSNEALREIAEVTASQWGMVTSAQARAFGVSRLTLSRLAEAGHLERLAHGVYRDAGAPSDEHEDLRAAWLSTEPQLFAAERLRNRASGVVVASSSAAMLHGVGSLWATRHEFVAADRRQTQRPEIRYRQRRLDDRDVALVEGLPAMVLERTLVDLLDVTGELTLVADALSSAAAKQHLDHARLSDLLCPFAARHGFKRHDGDAVLDRLLELAGLDVESRARRISLDSELGPRVLVNFLERAKLPPELPDSLGSTLRDFLRSHLVDSSQLTSNQLDEWIKSVHAAPSAFTAAPETRSGAEGSVV